MSCGDAANAWVPSVLGSVWSGTVDGDSLAATFTVVGNAAASVVGEIPGVGTWVKNSEGFHWTAALEGYTWHFTVHAEACNPNGDVTSAAGTAVDGNNVSHSVAMTRTT